MFINSSWFISSFMAGVGGWEIETSVNASQPPSTGSLPGTGLIPVSAEMWPCLGSHKLSLPSTPSLHPSEIVFWGALLLRFGFHLDLSGPPTWFVGPDAFGWEKETLPNPLMKGGKAGLTGPEAYFRERSPQLGHKSSCDPPPNPAVTHLSQGPWWALIGWEFSSGSRRLAWIWKELLVK